MCRGVLLSLPKVSDYTVHVLSCRHEEVDSFEIGLRVPPFGNGFYHCGLNGEEGWDGSRIESGHTGDILLQDIELLQNRL